MLLAPYLSFSIFFLFAASLRLIEGRSRILVLVAGLALLNWILFQGILPAMALATGLSLFTIFIRALPARIAAGFALTAAMICFKLPTINGTSGQALPFLTYIPLGFSFQYFAVLGLWIDEARRPVKHAREFLPLLGTLLFAPALVAGPYISATYLLEKLKQEPVYLYAREGLCLFSWGLLKKACADALTVGALSHFFSISDQSVPVSLARLLIFSLRLYLDFSGYADMARGAALLLGYDLPENFNRPFFARTYADFWSRWNESLSRWFKEYLYHPLIVRYPAFRSRVPLSLYLFSVSALVCGLIALWHGLGIVFGVWYLIVLSGLWLPSIVKFRALTAIWILATTSIVLSGSVTAYGAILINLVTGGAGTSRHWAIAGLLFFAGLLLQWVDFRVVARVARSPLLSAGCGVACWLMIFILAFRGQPFLYASF